VQYYACRAITAFASRSRGLRHRHVRAIRLRRWPTALLAPVSSLCACASRHRQLSTACQYHTRNTSPRTTAPPFGAILRAVAADYGSGRESQPCGKDLGSRSSRGVFEVERVGVALFHSACSRIIDVRCDDPLPFDPELMNEFGMAAERSRTYLLTALSAYLELVDDGALLVANGNPIALPLDAGGPADGLTWSNIG
jgi:hypothetical protein